MSGHSKWATTKHRKAAQDAKRSALFSKLARNITVAAKEGGDPNPDNNASLAAAIEKAKGYSMPKDKIKTAIDKAFGSGKDAANYETVVYEGYGPAGVAVLCEALTDNRNRTAADVRAAFSHSGGNLGTSGSVAFQFDRKGQIMVSKEVETGDKKNPIGPNGAAADEEEFMLAVAEGRPEDVQLEWSDDWAVSVVLASEGYPGAYEKGKVILGIEEAEELPGVTVFHAGTRRNYDGELLTNGGRVLNVVAKGDSFEEARERAYEACDLINFEGKMFRHDIGKKALQGRSAWDE